MITLIRVSDQTTLDECLKIRGEVFIEEQHVPISEEIDEHDMLEDHIADHYLFMDQDIAIGTIRCLKKTPGIIKVGRVAIRKNHRGFGFGRQMMELVEQEYPNALRFVLDAQEYAIPFYERCGYVASGEIFLDAGIRHRHMEKFNHS